jgi:hypothetical protein
VWSGITASHPSQKKPRKTRKNQEFRNAATALSAIAETHAKLTYFGGMTDFRALPSLCAVHAV